MGKNDGLDIRVYIPMLLVVLIPISLVKNLKYLVPFSALANIFILVSFVITLYYIFSDNLEVGGLELMANVEQLPLFFSTVIFAMEGIGVVSTFSDIFVSTLSPVFWLLTTTIVVVPHPLTSKHFILYIYSTNTDTEYFKYSIYSPFLSLQNAVCFIILTYLVPLLFTFYTQSVLKFKKNNSGVETLN